MLRRWWASGDVELQKQGLIEAERTEVDIIGSVARDPSHPLHKQAISGLEFEFEEPEWQDCKIGALSHGSAGVRHAAASTLLWDDPVAAETALQEAASDEDERVSVAAIETLKYYLSRSTAGLLHSLLGSTDGERLTAARKSFGWIRDEFLATLVDAGSEKPVDHRLRAWMSPVWKVLDFIDAEQQPGPREAPHSGGRSNSVAPPPVARIIEALSVLDGAWQPRFDALRRYEWSAVPSNERAELAGFFVGHPDPAVRERAGPALAAWDDVDRLLELARDPVSFVRKGAVYHLHDVPYSSDVAELTWKLVSSGEIASTRGQEALRTYAVHAPSAEVTERLIELALHDQRESLRYEAVCLLDPPAIGSVLTLLTQPALMTWSVHSMLLTRCASDGIAPPPLDHLGDVDNLRIADDLARLQ